MTQPVPTIDM